MTPHVGRLLSQVECGLFHSASGGGGGGGGGVREINSPQAV